MKALALCLLAVLVTRHYAWDLAPPELAGVTSKMLGALEALSLLGVIAYAYRHTAVWVVCCYGAWEHAQTAICSWAYIVRPWTVAPGEPMCSAATGVEIGAVGIAIAAALAYWLNLSKLPVNLTAKDSENE
jgi:hypothetical protein